MAESELALLVEEWEYHLRAKNLSPRDDRLVPRSGGPTRHLPDRHRYHRSRRYRSACDREVPDRACRNEFSPGTVLTRFRALRVLFNWLVDQEELERSPMDEDEGTARRTDPTRRAERYRRAQDARRDQRQGLHRSSRSSRCLRFMLDTGCRIGEAITLRVADLDTKAGVALVYGKGRKAASCRSGTRRRRRSSRISANVGSIDSLMPKNCSSGSAAHSPTSPGYRIVSSRAEAVGFKMHPHQTTALLRSYLVA